MRTPSPSTAFFGHPVIATPLMLGGVGLLALFLTQGQGGGVLLALPVAVGMARLGKAVSAVSAHRAWKRAWDAMDEPPARRTVPWKPMVASIFAVLVLAHASANPDHPGVQAGAAFIALGLLLALAASIVRRLRRRWRSRPHAKAATDAGVVTICARPAFPVPPLRDAYTALPAYCWQVLGRQ